MEQEMATYSSILACINRLLHGQRSLAGCSPWCRKELGMTEHITHTHTQTHTHSNTHMLKVDCDQEMIHCPVFLQELLAHGLSNVIGSFFFCIPSAAAMGRTAGLYGTGAKTQVTSFFSRHRRTERERNERLSPREYCSFSSLLKLASRQFIWFAAQK